MKKNIPQDVIPPKRSIRNIDMPSRSRRLSDKVSHKKDAKTISSTVIEESIPENNEYVYKYDEPTKSSRKILYISVAVFVVAVAFGVSALFQSAKVTVTPKQQIKAFNEGFVAKKDASSGLSFQIVTNTKDIEKSVSGTGEQKVDTKAMGRIVVYNNYSSQSQKLVATTRFQTPEGLIFRAIDSVTVPGRQVKSGKTIAGSVEIAVEADKSGAEYNIALKDFTIPGLKGDPKYSQIYARSKTEMSGGFSGLQKVVSKEVIDATDKELEEELMTSLSKDIASQIPENFVLYSGSISYEFDHITQANITNTTSETQNVLLKKKGRVSALIFDKGSLSRVIITKVIPEGSNDLIKIVNLGDLNFSYGVGTKFDYNTNTSVNFNLAGDADFVWVFDENKLKSELLGLSKKNADTIIGTYETIIEAWVEVYPFWNQTIPSDPKKVTIFNTLAR